MDVRKPRIRKAIPKERKCVRCGAIYIRCNKLKGYCSRSCGQLAVFEARGVERKHDLRRARPKECTVCGVISKRVQCSDECRRAAGRLVWQKKHRRPTECTCKTCGELFIRQHARRSDRCQACSERIKKANVRKYQRKHERVRGKGSDYRKRARRAGVEYMPLSRKKIYERDGYRCGICGRKVDATKKAPHPRSPSLDHIVPLSKGGGHVESNVQCACWGCNVKKGAKAGGQLRLAVA